jgi:drug/metabolite transporter (DMT)-like permease
MGTALVIGLIVIAIALFLAARKGHLSNETLQTLANIAAIVALIAAAAVFVIPSAVSPESALPRPDSMDDSLCIL